MAFLRKLLYLLERRDKIIGAGLLGMMILGGLFEALGVALLFPFLALVNDPSAVERSDLLQSIGDIFGLSGTRDLLIMVAALILAITVFKAIYMTVLLRLQYRYIFRLQEDVSRRLFSAYLFSPYTFHLKRNSAELLRNASTEVFLVFMHVLAPLSVMVVEVTVVLILVGILVVVSPGPALAALAVLAAFIAGSQIIAFRRLGEHGTRQVAEQAEMMRWVNQGLGSIKETKILGREGYFASAYGVSTARYADALRFLRVATEVPRVVLEGILVGGIVCVVIVLLATGTDLDEVLPTIGLFGLAAIRLMPSSSRILAGVSSVRFFAAALNPVADDLRELDRIRTEQNRAAVSGDGHFEEIGEIKLENVGYRYEGASAPALEGISLSIAAGESIGFVGPSGAGKTTLVDLLLGLLTPSAGRVLVGGVDVAPRLASWQRCVGYIPQPVYLMDDTIRRNVAFGLPDSEIDDERVRKALRSAKLMEFVGDLPEGLDSSIGEHGTRISGGQRQRIGIARALYHDAQVLVLDEATAALDNATESEVTRAIAQFGGDKTVITIAHRLSTVRDCDRLYFLMNGRLKAVGTYDELVRSNDAFREMALAGAGRGGIEKMRT